MILKDGKVLLGKRKGSHGSGEYAFPGGHLEFGESFEECALREVREESGVEINDLHFQYLANVAKYNNRQYVHIGMIAQWSSGEPMVNEPEKCESWSWYSTNDLPTPMFEMCRLAIDSSRTGQNYYDFEA